MYGVLFASIQVPIITFHAGLPLIAKSPGAYVSSEQNAQYWIAKPTWCHTEAGE